MDASAGRQIGEAVEGVFRLAGCLAGLVVLLFFVVLTLGGTVAYLLLK